MPPSVLLLEARAERYQQGGRCRQYQEKDETGAGFAPAFPGVHGSSLRTRCRNSSRKPSGLISNIVEPCPRNSAANRSASATTDGRFRRYVVSREAETTFV